MAMLANEWGSRRGKSRFAPNSQINVTPFVDVMLVLLIVFMVAAPLMTVTVPVDLAKSDAKPKPNAQPLMITVTSDGKIFVQDQETPKDSVVALIQQLSNGSRDQRIYLRGDGSAPYESVVEVMGLIDAAGFSRIGLMGSTQQLPVK
jgi:biopolymer transport protein TolR